MVLFHANRPGDPGIVLWEVAVAARWAPTDGRGKMLVQVGKLVADHESIGEMIQTVVRMVHNAHGEGFVLEKV